MRVSANANPHLSARALAPPARRHWIAASGMACAVASAPANAIDFSAVFSLKGQSVYAPGPAVDVNTNQRLGPPAFSFGKEYGGMVDPCVLIDCPTGVRAGADTNGSFGLNYGAKFNSGSYDLLYPVYAHINEPAAFSNAIGTPFTLASSFKVAGYTAPGYQEFLNGQRVVAKLTTHSPTLQAYVDLDARFHAFVGAQACLVGVCTGPALGPVDGNASRTLVGINRNNDGRIQIGDDIVALKQYRTLLDGNVTARLNIPNVDGVSSAANSDATHLRSFGRDSLVSLGANVGNMVSKAVGIPLVGNAAGIGYNLLSINAGLGLDLAQTISVQLTPLETFNFLSPVRRQLADGTWSGFTKQITVPLGENLVLKSSVINVGVVPSTALQVTFSNLTELVVQGDFNVQALAADIYGLKIGPLYDSGPGGIGKFNIPLYQDSFSFATGAISGLPFNVQQSLPVSTTADPGYRALFIVGDQDEQGLAPGEVRAVQYLCRVCPSTHVSDTDPSLFSQSGERVFMVNGDTLKLATNHPGEVGTDASQLALLYGTGFTGQRAELIAPMGLPSPVPEPSAWLLMGAGLAAVGSVVRRRANRAA